MYTDREEFEGWMERIMERFDRTEKLLERVLRKNNTLDGEEVLDNQDLCLLLKVGIRTLHDETLYDAPGYTDSYKRSRAGVQTYLERYPSIKVVLDVHRDAIEDSDGTRVKPVCEIDGESTAQVMVIAGCGNGSSIVLPNWRLNLRFAAEWEAAMESAYPGLTRPVLCGYRFYNQDLTTGSLLIEIGGHANTLDEALRAGEYAAEALAGVLGG